MVEISDRVYGKEEITEPVLLELMRTGAMQRLKGISQYGMPDDYYHRKGFSRYEHSVGVLILLRRLGADLKEQVAGLLHDVSHTAFSHVVDWVVGDPSVEDYQDNLLLETLKQDELSSLLKKYDFDLYEIADLEIFSLLEQPAPKLCADRIDYVLREVALEGDSVEEIVDDLRYYNGEIVFNSLELAEKFGLLYSLCQKDHWAGDQAKARYHVLSYLLKQAFDRGILSVEDLHRRQDKDILSFLHEVDHEGIKEGLKLLQDGLTVRSASSDEGVLIKKKFRYIDPDVIVEGDVRPLSALSHSYSELLKNDRKRNEQEEYVTIHPLEVVS